MYSSKAADKKLILPPNSKINFNYCIDLISIYFQLNKDLKFPFLRFFSSAY